MIFYFTGTGNSEYVARKIQSLIQDDLVSLNDLMKSGGKGPFNSEQPLIFVCPTYAWRLPRVVDETIRNSLFTGNKKAYFVMTCGEDIGNAEKYIRDLCLEKQLTFMGVTPVVMPENYITMYSAPEKGKIETLIKEAQPIIKKMANDIQLGQSFKSGEIRFTDHLKSGLVNSAFYPIFVKAKGYYATDACVNCGKCENLCPLNNIQMEKGKPVWANHCTQCMACICGCPVVAIEYKNKTQGKNRYWCPEEKEFE